MKASETALDLSGLPSAALPRRHWALWQLPAFPAAAARLMNPAAGGGTVTPVRPITAPAETAVSPAAAPLAARAMAGR